MTDTTLYKDQASDTETSDDVAQSGRPEAAIEEQIIHMATLNFERMPMLEMLFDRFALSLGSALKSHSGAIAEVALRNFTYTSCGKALDGIDTPGMIAVVKGDTLDGNMALVIEPSLLFTMLEFMLGGRSAKPEPWQPRTFTSIEKRFARGLCEAVLRELSQSLRPVTHVKFEVVHLEHTPRALVLAPPANPCVLVELDVLVEGHGGKLKLILPNSAFENLKPLLDQSFLGGALGGDDGWRGQLTESLQDTNVVLNALLHEITLPLTQVLNWSKGQVIDLGIDFEHEATVHCSGKPMFFAAMGRRRNGSVALRITEKLDELDEGYDDDLPD